MSEHQSAGALVIEPSTSNAGGGGLIDGAGAPAVLHPDRKLTASRVACLMTGDADRIMNLWRLLIGDPSYQEEDLSGIWAVALGTWTERLNLDWYERRTGKPLTQRGEYRVHPQFQWAGCTLDAWDDQIGAPVECKHVGGWEPREKILERYAPQAHWQMMCTGATSCVFSIIEGAREPVIEIMELDREYAATLMERAREFWRCVETLTPPVPPPAVAAPAPKPVKTYDMTGRNEWASEAVTWITTRQAAKDFAASEKALKALVPPDAIKCNGHGIQVSRNKAGSLSIRAEG